MKLVIITDFVYTIHYTLTKNRVHNMHIKGELVFGKNRPKNRFFHHRPQNFNSTKKHEKMKCLKKHYLQILFNMFSCEINNNNKEIAHYSNHKTSQLEKLKHY